MLLQLVYLSTAARLMSDSELATLLDVSRERNAAAGLTGMLLYADGQFMQALEGPAEPLISTYGRIRRDPRHRSLIEMLRQGVPDRSFADWSMGFRRGARRDLDALPGYSDFLDRPDGSAGADVARAFLHSFRSSAQRFRV
ncbi:MAG: BLUF domain-containing protein [Alphaproteobacteria bacterium]|nr:BLUF domain-containing protein [Alphaproteobacteria bacterium]